MFRRRRINLEHSVRAPLRSSLADAAFAVEERLFWRGGEGLRQIADAVRWPFERATWALERAIVWPLEERAGDLSGPLRTLGVLAAALAATALGVLALVWISAGGDEGPSRATAPPAPVAQPLRAPERTAPVLQGAAPDFTREADGGVAKARAAEGGDAVASDPRSTAAPAAPSEELGPQALEVARRFAGAFVLYEVGADKEKVRNAFAATASPDLTRELLQRPPRQPANVTVPQAKVLNVVPGPRHGATYALSVSLLRVGVTSELRIEMQYDRKRKAWQVTDARG